MIRHTIAALALLGLYSCGGNGGGTQAASDSTAHEEVPVTVTEGMDSPEFPDATLHLASVSPGAKTGDSVKIAFAFSVVNYKLGDQTGDTSKLSCNNSAQGQHIHFIMDNKPYKALYEPKTDATLKVNSEHYLMAFLSRSYHESIKQKSAAILYHFKVDANGKIQPMDDAKSPMLFYSRPKGDYIGKDTKNVLLDFYIQNTALGADSSKVKVVLSGKGGDTSFTVSNWKPMLIHDMAMGKSKITLTLLDSAGKERKGPNTKVSREFTLASKEPVR